MWAIATTGRPLSVCRPVGSCELLLPLGIHLSLPFCILINSSETTGPVWTKLWWNGLQMVLSRNCVRRPRPPIKIAAVTKNRKFVKQSLKNDLLWNYWVSGAQTIVKWSLVVPFQNCVWWSHATCMRVCRHQQT